MSVSNNKNGNRLLLIMLPYAGGSAQAYFRLAKKIQDRVEIKIATVEYAGHGIRFRKRLAENFDELVEDAKKQIITIINQYRMEDGNISVVLFGHSLGGVVLAHTASDIYAMLGDSLKGLILSSCLPPEKIQTIRTCFQTEQQLIDYLCVVRGIPTDLTNSKEFKEYVLPYVKNDFRILNEYHGTLNNLLKCKVYAIWADLDYGITKNAMLGWQAYCVEPIEWYEAEGMHFYFEDNVKIATDILEDIINKCKGENDDCE